jgi:hypothetical protein
MCTYVLCEKMLKQATKFKLTQYPISKTVATHPVSVYLCHCRSKPTQMHHTPEQKNILRTTWIAAAFFGLLFGIIYFWKDKSSEHGFPQYKLMFLFNYAFFLLLWAAWSWDWLVTKNYLKAGLLLLATAGFWALGEWVIPKNRFSTQGNGDWEFFRNRILYSPVLWMGVARALLEINIKKAIPALLTGITMVLLYMLFYTGLTGLFIFIFPYLAIWQYLFHDQWATDFATFMYNGVGYNLFSVGITAAEVFFVQWVFQFYQNLLHPEHRVAARGIFGARFPNVSGRYYAVLYPLLYLFTIGAATGAVTNALSLFIKNKGGSFSFYRISRGIIPTSLENNHLQFVLLPVCMLLTVFLFKALRTLVLSRCISLHKKFGLSYLFSFVPFLNIIPWIILSVTKTPVSETDQMQYAAEMNNGQTQRSMVTINLLLTLSIISAIFTLVSGMNGLGPLLLIVTLIYLGMYIAFIYQPGMLYGLIGLKLFFLIVLFAAKNTDRDAAILYIFLTVYSIMMLIWQKRIFFPDVEMPMEMKFDGETEMNMEKPNDK